MLKVPRSVVDNPNAGGSSLFPAGTFMFTIQTPTNDRVQCTTFEHLPDWATATRNEMGEDITPGFTGDREQTSVWLGDAEVLHGDAMPGARKFFQSFITADGDVTLNDLEEESNGEGSQIRSYKNVGLYASLAEALGAVIEEGDDEVGVAPEFLDMLRSNAYDDQQVIATVEHYKLRGGPNKGDMRHRISGFEAAAG